MLGRAHRFHGYNSLNGVYRRGKTARAPMMSLRFAGRGADKPYRVAVVVSRKVNKSAVTRNRIRRRIYAAVRETARQEETAVRPGTDLVFTVFNDQVAELPQTELKETIAKLLGKAG